MIEDFIEELCEILSIEIPDVSYDVSNFSSDTMLAQCSPDGSAIYIKKVDNPSPDHLFSIAHELRHVWQIRTDKKYTSEYKPVELCASLEEYNLQIAELDANAFAGLIMIDFFHIKPLFEGLPEAVKSEIFNRMELLSIELSE